MSKKVEIRVFCDICRRRYDVAELLRTTVAGEEFSLCQECYDINCSEVY